MDNKILKALFEKPMVLHIDFTENNADIQIGIFWVVVIVVIMFI